MIAKIDETAGIAPGRGAVTVLERGAFVCLVLTAFAAPHSIAATQTAWLTGMLFWGIRLFIRPRISFRPGFIDYALWAFVGWSVVSSLASYAPDISIDKLRGVSLFLIFYFAYHNLRNSKAVRLVAAVLIGSAMIAVVWTPVERLIGRGVAIYDFPSGPFRELGLDDGDTILEVNGRRVSSLEEIRQAISAGNDPEKFKALVYHSDAYVPVEIPRRSIRPAATAGDELGVGRWSKGRNWRSAGFYGHYTTFAEVLQLIAALAFGILVASFVRGDPSERRLRLVLAACIGLMAMALIMTVTRGSQLAFAVGSVAVVLVAGSRRLLLASVAILVPLAVVGLIVLQQARGVGFFDRQDNSTTWRQTVYREAFGLWTASPRNFIFGVGMDSIRRYAKEWRLFDDGRLPMGHFHSTPLQLVVERGLPALLIWLVFLGAYLRSLWRGFTDSGSGIALGALGGTIGFFVSGIVHYNLGDAEVAMVFFLIMGLGLASISKRG